MFIQAGGAAVAATPGDSILSALRQAGQRIQSVCGGRGMCGTCRVSVDAAWLPRLPAPSFAETRLLRILRQAHPNHRLACQTILDASHDGLICQPDPPPTRQIQQEISP